MVDGFVVRTLELVGGEECVCDMMSSNYRFNENHGRRSVFIALFHKTRTEKCHFSDFPARYWTTSEETMAAGWSTPHTTCTMRSITLHVD